MNKFYAFNDEIKAEFAKEIFTHNFVQKLYSKLKFQNRYLGTSVNGDVNVIAVHFGNKKIFTLFTNSLGTRTFVRKDKNSFLNIVNIGLAYFNYKSGYTTKYVAAPHVIILGEKIVELFGIDNMRELAHLIIQTNRKLNTSQTQ